MNILQVSHRIPYPLNEGGKVAQFRIIEYLCSNNEVMLVAEKNYPEIYEDAKALNRIIPKLKIEILDVLEPKPQNSFGNTVLNKVNKLQWRLQKEVNKKQPKSSSISDNNIFIYPTRPRRSSTINQLIELNK